MITSLRRCQFLNNVKNSASPVKVVIIRPPLSKRKNQVNDDILDLSYSEFKLEKVNTVKLKMGTKKDIQFDFNDLSEYDYLTEEN